jgi:hypothetical protein
MVADWKSAEAIVKQGIAGSVDNSLFLKIKNEGMAVAMWVKLKDEFKKKSKMMAVDLRQNCKKKNVLKDRM